MQPEYSIDEIIKWSCNKNINPKTKRKIKETGKIYKKLNKQFLLNFKEGINPLLITDNKDPISQDNIWELDNNNKKIYGNIPPKRLVVYKDNKSFYRGFDANSLVLLNESGINTHPITNNVIPEYVFKLALERAEIEKEEKSEEQIVKDLAFSVFQKLSFESVYISEQFFLDFTNLNLNKFHYELFELYNDNLTVNQKKLIDPNSKILLKSKNKLDKYDMLKKQKYLLNQLDMMLDAPKNLKMMVSYIITGSLTIVSPEIRKLYPDIAFNFLV
tara:strand:- start:532 stop:1350 length:819 start_codon:yes stop_codon:yes gene_type:complete